MLKKRWLALVVMVMAGLLLAACTAAPAVDDEALADAEAQIAALQEQLSEAAASGGEVDEAAVAELEAQLEAAQAALEEAQTAPAEESEFEAMSVEFKNPDTFTHLVIGEPESLDPAIAYDSASLQVLNQVYDKLLFFKEGAADEYAPMLATDWEISEDGLTYTFQIREGVTFHEGGTLEPHDVAYTFQRNLLLGWDFLGAGGPMGLFYDPFFGVYGIGEEGDGGLLDIAGSDEAVCQTVKDAIVADDEAGTVTMHLNYAATYLPQILAQYWGSIYDSEWMIEQGAWDGDCATWREWYLPEVTGTHLYNMANGTGPYKLDHWTPGEEIVLTANEDWWLDGPLWEGSTVDGVPELKTVVIRLVEEWGTRLATFQAGDADMIDPELAFAAQIDPMVKEIVDYQTGEATENNPEGIFRMYTNLPATNSTDMFMNFDIQTEGGNPWIGSGELDGRGVPPDFFSDVHVRKAFNYCFDRETFIADVRQGEGIPHRGPIISGMLGYEEDSFIYDYDLAKCEEEFKLAWDGQVWENGFTITLSHNTGNDSRRIAMEILKSNIEQINPNFQVIIANMPWPTYLAERRAGRFPIHQTGWIEDFHHPHNWVVPYMSCNGDFSGRQFLPEEVCGAWEDIMYDAVREPDPAVAGELYAQLQSEAMEQAIDIFVMQPIERDYVQLWVSGYYYNPLFGNSTQYYAALSKVAP